MFPVAAMLVAAYHTIPHAGDPVVVCLLSAGAGPGAAAGAARASRSLPCSAWRSALFFSAANVFFRDFGKIVQTITQFVTFRVPMMYPYSLVLARLGEPIATLLPRQPDRRGSAAAPARLLDRPTSDPALHRPSHLPDHLFDARA